MGEIFEISKPAEDLEFTGERMTSAAIGTQIEVEHLHRYFLARPFCAGMDVLDVASGEGYGSAILAQVARSVVGVELDAATVAHASGAYRRPNLTYRQGDARALPLPDDSVDIVISFETLEHLVEHEQFLTEVRRVLRPGGRFVVSTPDRDIYSRHDTPANPYHVLELRKVEFTGLLSRHFSHVGCLSQRTMMGSAMLLHGDAGAGLTFERRGPDHVEMNPGLPRAAYLVGIASDTPIDPPAVSFFIDRTDFGHVLGDLARSRQTESDLRGAMTAVEARAVKAEVKWRAQGVEIQRLESALQQAVRRDEESAVRAEEIERAQSDLRRAEDALAQRTAEVEHYRHQAEVLRDQCDDAEERARVAQEWFDAVRNSTSWKIMVIPRRLGRRFPGVARFVRRVARWGWRLMSRNRPIQASAPPVLTPPLRPVAWSAPVPRPTHTPVPPPAPDADKLAMLEPLRIELGRFLTSRDRLGFPSVDAPEISVLLVLFNQAHFTLRCLTGLLAQTGASFEVVIVDNASSDRTAEMLQRLDNVRVLVNDTNVGFLLAVNQGAEMARGRTLLLLNNDAFPRAGALEMALSRLDSSPDIGAVGCRIVLPSGVLQEAGSIIWNDGSALGYARGMSPEAGEAMFARGVDYCSGAFLLTPTTLWRELGGFDEIYAPAYYEEADYCLRLRTLGKRVMYEPRAVIDHFEFGSQTASGQATALQIRNRKTFLARHHALLGRDHLPMSESNILFARETPRDRKRLLFIDRQMPSRRLGSGFPRARFMLNEAAAAGWFVSFYPTFVSEVDWDEAARELSPDIEICHGRGVAGLPEFLRERRGYYHAILVSRPENMEIFQDIFLQSPDLVGSARLIYDAEAVYATREVLRARVLGLPIDQNNVNHMIAQEMRLAEGVDAVVTVSPTEQALFSSRQAAPSCLLSHSLEPRSDAPPYDERSGFLFVGRLLEKGTPNYDGLSWFIQSVWPLIRERLPDARMDVAGLTLPEPSELRAPGISLLGPVENLTPLYDRARMFLAPTRFAAGVPIKVLEAGAAGLPTVATPLIASQLGWVSGREIVASDDPSDLAEQAVDLYASPARWETMRQTIVRRLAADHDPGAFRAELLALLGGPAAPAGDWYSDDAPEVSVIIPNLNRADMTLQCIRHLHRYTAGHRFEIIVVDNGSRPEAVTKLNNASERFRLISLQRNHYFGEANNIGVEAAHGEFICLMNNDAFVGSGWLAPLLEALRTQPDAGMVGPRFIYPDGRLQEAGAVIHANGYSEQLGKHGYPCDPNHASLRVVDYVSAATALMRRDVFLRVLGFDLCWEPAYYEDTDLAFKLMLIGLKTYYVPNTTVVHVENATSSDPRAKLQLHNVIEANRGKFLARWGAFLEDRQAVPPGLIVDQASLARVPPAAAGVRRVVFHTPYDLTPGGGERVLLTLAAALSSDHDVTLVSIDSFSRVRILTVGRELDLDLSRIRVAARHDIRDDSFDLGFVIGNEALPSIAGPARENIFFCQFPFPADEAVMASRRAYWPGYQRVIVYSEYTRMHLIRQLDALGMEVKPIDVLSPPVPRQRFQSVKQAGILNVGRFFTGWHCKRQDQLIEAFRALTREVNGIELHLVGSLHPEPENRAYYASLVEAAKGLPVRFHPNCDLERLRALYQSCRVYWHATGLDAGVEEHPEKAEHFGISIVEAMSAGCVPIAFDAGGPTEIIRPGETGFLFRDIDELRALTRPLLLDPNGREASRMGEAAAKAAETYSEQLFVTRARELIVQVMAQHR